MGKLILFLIGYFILYSLIKSIFRSYRNRQNRQNHFSKSAGKTRLKEDGIEDADFEEIE